MKESISRVFLKTEGENLPKWRIKSLKRSTVEK
jgi:hypothetical protein